MAVLSQKALVYSLSAGYFPLCIDCIFHGVGIHVLTLGLMQVVQVLLQCCELFLIYKQLS